MLKRLHCAPPFSLLIFFLLSQFSFAGLPANDANGRPLPTLAPLVKKIKPAVVNISVQSTQTVNNPLLNDPFFRHFFNVPKNYSQKRQTSSAGSGVIINAQKGTVITNYHVIKDADQIQVGLHDGRTLEAELIGSDPDVDIAVLKIDNDQLQALPIADSSQLEVGDFAVAIGNPFGLNHTVTTGIVSALERSGLGIEGYENFIQTDASINPGNSGGALVNLNGELIGINTAILAPSGGNVGIGFAIPSNMAMNSTEQILEYGEVRRGRLGIYIQNITPDLAEAFQLNKNQKGVLVTKVEVKSPADKAGLKAEDIIVAINGKKTNTAAELRNSIGLARIGSNVELEYIRKGKKRRVNVKINQDESQVSTHQNKPAQLQGVELTEVNEGLLITAIEAGSPAQQTGLEANDIITEVNRRRVKTVSDLNATAGNPQLLLRIIRQGNVFYLVIR